MSSTWGCPIDGEAAIHENYNDDRTIRELIWVTADPEIHVTRDLLEQADSEGLVFIKSKYELGEECPYDHRIIHARLREQS